MSRADYAHHNEEADRIWWEEEGKHQGHEEPDDESWRDEPEPEPDEDDGSHDGYIREDRG